MKQKRISSRTLSFPIRTVLIILCYRSVARYSGNQLPRREVQVDNRITRNILRAKTEKQMLNV